MLKVYDLQKTYEGANAPSLCGLTFSLHKGEIYGLLGPNGAGKSTTVSIISGLLKMNGGNIENSFQRMGIAPQEIALFPTLTAFENIIYFGELHGIKRDQLKSQALKMLQDFQLIEKKDKQVVTFSGGMKRRLNLIIALLNEPNLLILDEPTAGVDVQSRNLIIEILKEQNKRGVTIMYSSHLMDEAERLCDRIGIIDNGKLVLEGNQKQLLIEHQADSLENLFLKLTGKKIRD